MKRHKYNAKKTTIDGITFDSKGEANRWFQLTLLERAGEINNLDRQVPVQLLGYGGGKIAKLIFDFRYFDTERNCVVYEDFKGVQTDVFKLKLKLFRDQYPNTLVRISTNKGVIDYETTD